MVLVFLQGVFVLSFSLNQKKKKNRQKLTENLLKFFELKNYFPVGIQFPILCTDLILVSDSFIQFVLGFFLFYSIGICMFPTQTVSVGKIWKSDRIVDWENRI